VLVPFAATARPQIIRSSIENLAQSHLKDDSRLIDIRAVNRNIIHDIRYATNNNFTGRRLYRVARCALRTAVARQLSLVQQDLAKRGLGLKVYDCYRPLSIQRQMWRLFPNPRYVANPRTGSKHNRGAAVDLTLVDRNGNELEMPTAFDNFTPRAQINYRGTSQSAQKNSQLLADAMKKRGFRPISSEWWHFDAVGWEQFSILDVPLESVISYQLSVISYQLSVISTYCFS
jgi:zinc D-Ala-D-Ala dipeptidase